MKIISPFFYICSGLLLFSLACSNEKDLQSSLYLPSEQIPPIEDPSVLSHSPLPDVIAEIPAAPPLIEKATPFLPPLLFPLGSSIGGRSGIIRSSCHCEEGPPGPIGPPGPTGPQGPIGPEGPRGPGCVEPLPTITRTIYVNKAGNDATADGSECFPFLTISAAMASITDAISPFPDPNNLTKRYAISIGPGQYIESLINLKANVQLVGTSTLLTRLQIPFDLNDPSWADLNFSSDPRSGFVNLSLLTGPLDFNFQTAQSVSGKLFFVSVNITPTPVFTALSTSVNQVNIRDSQLSGGYTQNGINMAMFGSYVAAGNITINSQSITDTQVNLVGGGINGNIIINVQSGHIPIDPLNLTSFAITENIFNPFPNSGALIINGVNNVITRVRATADSIPIRQRVTIVGTGTSLIRVDDAFGLAYTPNNPGDWLGTPPTTVQEALDRIAAQLGPI